MSAGRRALSSQGSLRASLPVQYTTPSQGASSRSSRFKNPVLRTIANAVTSVLGKASRSFAAAASSVRPLVMTSSTRTSLGGDRGAAAIPNDS